MRIGGVDLAHDVLVVAEIGNNHEGDVALAERLIELAAQAGVQAVKFQTIAPDRLVTSEQQERRRQLERFALSRADHQRLARAAQAAGVMFLSTPLHLDAVAWLNDLVPAFKIASGDNDFGPLLEAVAETGKPVILSTGMTDLDGVRRARSVIETVWQARGVRPGLALLHCVSAYPTPPDQANLAAIEALRSLGDAVGYSDHTLGIEAAPLAVAAGARIIEKHFTISRHHSEFRDHRLSAEPDELRAMVARVREVMTLMGSGEKTPRAAERASTEAARRSIVARRNLEIGHRLTLEDIDWLRPGGGLSPMHTGELVGRTLSRSVRRGERIAPNMFC